MCCRSLGDMMTDCLDGTRRPSLHQSPREVLMVRPRHFAFDPETAASNAFQRESQLTQEQLQRAVEAEFDAAVKKLRKVSGVRVRVFDDRDRPACPDAIFPNNWFSVHEGDRGPVVIYPMCTLQRRRERRMDVVEYVLKGKEEKDAVDLIDYSPLAESDDVALEGTGSIVFDHLERVAYACRSPRTNEDLFRKLCRRLDYEPMVFSSFDADGMLIYHTNVMMWIGTKAVGICLESIRDIEEREAVRSALKRRSGRKIVDLSQEETAGFAGNCLEVRDFEDEARLHLAISSTAVAALSEENRKAVESSFAGLVVVDIPNIEEVGGGGIRCMMAGNHLA